MNGNFEIPGTFLILIFDFIFPVIFPCLEIVGNLYFFLVDLAHLVSVVSGSYNTD